MFTIPEFQDAVAEEIRLVRHIATKIDPQKLDWRMSPGQRSTLELMRYLAVIGLGCGRAILGNDWSVFGPLSADVAKLDLAGFDAAMAKQERELRALFASIPPADLGRREVTLPWNRTCTLGQALYETCVRFLIAYRMQLFLHVKASGRSELDTYNAWRGMDRPAQPAP